MRTSNDYIYDKNNGKDNDTNSFKSSIIDEEEFNDNENNNPF